MGFKTAAQVLLDEMAHIHRRIERIREEMIRLRGRNELSDLRAEGFVHQIEALEHDLIKFERELELRKGDEGARHSNQIMMRSDMGPGTRSWKNR